MIFEEILPLLMFIGLFVFILSGLPVAFALAGTALIFALIGVAFELFIITDLSFIPSKIYGIITNFTLAAVPLFVFMGITLDKSGLAEDLLFNMDLALRRVKGGLIVAVIIVGGLLAASTGIVGATVVTMGVIALPGMLKRGYNPALASGVVAASGTLGQIIPPSIVLILLADMMNVAAADLFAGALIPGLILVVFYISYVVIMVVLNPELAPPAAERVPIPRSKLFIELFSSVMAPLALMIIVLGSILFGIASPTEAAACGAFGALFLSYIKRKLSYSNLKEIMDKTATTTAMVFTLLIGAQFFAVVFRGLYGDEVIVDLIKMVDVNPAIILFAIMALIFVLGFFLDFFEICFIVIPVIAPILIVELGMNPLWIAVLLAVNLQTSFLTPPFGFALFYLKGIAPPDLKTITIYRGVVPFIAIQLLVLCLIWIFPALTTALPNYLFGK